MREKRVDTVKKFDQMTGYSWNASAIVYQREENQSGNLTISNVVFWSSTPVQYARAMIATGRQSTRPATGCCHHNTFQKSKQEKSIIRMPISRLGVD